VNGTGGPEAVAPTANADVMKQVQDQVRRDGSLDASSAARAQAGNRWLRAAAPAAPQCRVTVQPLR
jgi:hypothetical protein